MIISCYACFQVNDPSISSFFFTRNVISCSFCFFNKDDFILFFLFHQWLFQLIFLFKRFSSIIIFCLYFFSSMTFIFSSFMIMQHVLISHVSKFTNLCLDKNVHSSLRSIILGRKLKQIIHVNHHPFIQWIITQ